MSESFQDLLDFTSFTHQFQQVKRALYATGENRPENDAEHSYQLALIAWYLISTRRLSLDINKVIQYALIHDLVESYAGDTAYHTNDQSLKDSKAEREEHARLQIAQNFSHFPELSQLLLAYEERSDPEARFVYAVDKVLPVLNIYLDGGRSWREEGVTLEMIINKRTVLGEKISDVPEVLKVWDELLSLIQTDQKRLFGETDIIKHD